MAPARRVICHAGCGLRDAVEEVADHPEVSFSVAGDDLAHLATQGTEYLALDLREMLGRLDDHAATVLGVGTAGDVPGVLEPVEREREPAGRHAHCPGQSRRGGGPHTPEHVQTPEVAAIDSKAVGGPLVQSVDLGGEPAQRRADPYRLVLA